MNINELKMCKNKVHSVFEDFNLLGVVAQRILTVPQHLPGHECVEDGSPCQWHAKVEAKEPPVLY